MKKRFAIILAMIIAVTALNGCGGGSKSAQKEVKKGVKGGEPITLTIFYHSYGNIFDDDWPVFKKAAELTGVTLHGTASKVQTESDAAYNNMLVEEPLPDIIHYFGSNLKELGLQGGLIPLEDYIDEYAPNIKKFFEDCPQAKRVATASDGHIYYIPGSLSGIDKEALPSQGWFIRQDWLDKLGLETPKTVDEFYEVMKAFKDKDPNGNGKKDEIPIFRRDGGIGFLYTLFDTNKGWYLKGEDTHLGATEEEYKNAISNIAKWYNEGIIDKEIFTRGGQAREQLLSANLGGCTHDWFSSTGAYNATYKDTVKGLDFEPMAPPADINGNVVEAHSRNILHELGWGISKDNQHPEETMIYFDFWMGQQGQDLRSFGIEGVHYNVIDGKKVFIDEVLNAEGGVPSYLKKQGAGLELSTIGNIEAELAGMNEISRKGFEMYNDGGYVIQQYVKPQFTEEEQKVINKYWTSIDTYINEMEQKWILGISKVENDWDTYVDTLKKMHVDEVIEVYDKAHKREASY